MSIIQIAQNQSKRTTYIDFYNWFCLFGSFNQHFVFNLSKLDQNLSKRVESNKFYSKLDDFLNQNPQFLTLYLNWSPNSLFDFELERFHRLKTLKFNFKLLMIRFVGPNGLSLVLVCPLIWHPAGTSTRQNQEFKKPETN